MTQNARQLPARSLDSYVSGGITTKVLDDSFSYDANGNVLSLVDASAAPAADNRTWGVDPLLPTLYDGLDRLKQVKSANQWGLASYSYDPLDNLRTNQLGATTLTYSYDAGNRLSSLTNGLGSYWAITTDGRGNVTANALKAQAYQFDLAHRMNAVAGQESYLYDGHGRRARSLNLQTGSIEYYGYGADGRLLQDWSNRRQVRNGYVYLGNTVVGLYEVNLTNGTVTPKYQHTDALGSPVVTTNASKTVLSRMSYTPYGLPAMPMDGVGYTGHFMDVGTGLTYMQQRYYDPQIGRFLSIDPVPAGSQGEGSFSRYAYANNDPFGFVDPDGRQSARIGNGATAEQRAAAIQERIRRGHAERGWGLGTAAWRSGNGRTASNPDLSKLTPAQKVQAAHVVANQAGIDTTDVTFKIGEKGSRGAFIGDNGEVFLGEDRFASRSLLASTIGHEVEVHMQDQGGIHETDAVRHTLNEIEAYSYNIKNAERFGNTAAEVAHFHSELNRLVSELLPGKQP